MAATFSWNPDYNAGGDYAPRVLSAKFGEGYEQRVPDGINNNPGSWSLTFSNRTNADGDAIDAFLKTAGGYQWFWWTPPRASSAVKVKCAKWKKSEPGPNSTTVTATFDQVFDQG